MFVYIYMCVRICIYIYIYMYVYVYNYLSLYTYIGTHLNILTHVHVHIHLSLSLSLSLSRTHTHLQCLQAILERFIYTYVWTWNSSDFMIYVRFFFGIYTCIKRHTHLRRLQAIFDNFNGVQRWRGKCPLIIHFFHKVHQRDALKYIANCFLTMGAFFLFLEFLMIYLHIMGWLRLVSSLKLDVSFAKEPYKIHSTLRPDHGRISFNFRSYICTIWGGYDW